MSAIAYSAIVHRGSLLYPRPPRCAGCGFTIDPAQPRTVWTYPGTIDASAQPIDGEEPRKIDVELWSCALCIRRIK